LMYCLSDEKDEEKKGGDFGDMVSTLPKLIRKVT
jgi:hypothetical protein